MVSNVYSMLDVLPLGTTQTGLDQIVAWIGRDTGLAGANQGINIAAGMAAADALNHLILEAKQATGVAASGIFSEADVIAINSWIRQNRLTEFTQLHGDDNGAIETGFHLIQNNGANQLYRNANLVDTVVDGIYHIGFAIQNGAFLNEDGNANATVGQVAGWLTQLFTDRATTNTGLDRIAELIIADPGLGTKIPWQDIAAGTDAANSLNQLYVTAIATLHLGDDGNISEADIVQINGWIRADAARYANFVALHGDDGTNIETGYHLVQNDGATTTYFGKNLVNTVADGLYHVGFAIQNGVFRNEDGNANATVKDVADWVNYFYADQSNTGTGLDRIVDTIKLDTGLSKWTNAGDINAGAAAANSLNHLIIDAIQVTGVNSDGWLTTDDLRIVNGWIRTNEYAIFAELHGDDEAGLETGYHLVQNDGANTQYFGQNLINGIADSIYHIGFAIDGNNFLNEDGDTNATLSNVASWLNYFYNQKTVVYGSSASETLTGTEEADHMLGYSGNDTFNAGGGNDLLEGDWGKDVMNGGAGDDLFYGGGDDDQLDGGEGSDRYFISGNLAEGWASFQGYDSYTDTGINGIDTIVASGAGNGDIGLLSFSAANGIEVIDGTAVGGTLRLLGNWEANRLDFSTTQIVANNIVIEGDWGDDEIIGSQANETLIGGGGDDQLDGGQGSDRYLVTGNLAEGWSSFQGYDTYADTGTGVGEIDTIVASGAGNVDIGLLSFNADTGIEIIDGSAAAGVVTLVGNWESNVLDFSAIQFVGGNIQINGDWGNDQIIGSQGDDILSGGGDDDQLDGGQGSDRYLVTGNLAEGWSSFQGYDTYADTGTGVGEIDTIVASGAGNVDIGLLSFNADTGIEIIDGSEAAGIVTLVGNWESNVLDFSSVQFVGGNIQINGDWGNDQIIGSQGNDNISGGGDDDQLNGGQGGDRYVITGNLAEGWSSFQGYDTYADTGLIGTDTIVAVGAGNVDIGLLNFSATSGIEKIDGSGATGTVRLLGNWEANRLDFSSVQMVGTNLQIDGDSGNDSITGSTGNDVIIGGSGDDKVDGGQGSDRYVITGNYAGGWSSFQGYDTYTDKGTSGSDTIAAVGAGNVDIGLLSFGSSSGIEKIDGSGATGTVRLLGNWEANQLNFSTTQLIGSNLRVDGADGNDTLTGSSGNDMLLGGNGDDRLVGGLGTDQLTGGAGKNRFVFATVKESLVGTLRDTVTDFKVGTGKDTLDLGGIDANSLLAGNQAFTYLGTAVFSGIAGQLRFASGIISADINGDKTSDFELALTGVTSLTTANIVL